MKKLFPILLSVISLTGEAQTVDNIEMFNTRQLHGTPRFVGMGGAFTALGNDFSSIHLNPASASVYRTDNFGATLGFQNRFGDHSNFFNGANSSSNFSILLENMGLVKNWSVGPYKKETKLTFSMSYNKIAQFNRNYSVIGQNSIGGFGQGSLAYYWYRRQLPDGSEDGAFDLTSQQLLDNGLFEEYAAAQAGILYIDSTGVVSDVSFGDGNPAQTNIFYNRRERGSIGELSLSLGGAYEDKFFYGMSLGFPRITYSLTETVQEYNLPNADFPFDATSYRLDRTDDFTGNGVNVKLGLIYKPIQLLRIGLSYQSPTWYSVNQIYNMDVSGLFADGSSQSGNLLPYEYSYGLRTPSIFRVGTALVLGKKGIVSVDYEYSDPSQSFTYTTRSSFGVDDIELDLSNQDIERLMAGRSAVRAGGEYRIGKFFLRGGYGFSQSFYADPDNFKSDQITYSGGLGYRNNQFEVNLAYTRADYTRQDFVHNFNDINGNVREELVTSELITSNIVIGTSIRF